MRRRDFIGAVADAAVGWPLPTRGQQSATPLVGYLAVETHPNPSKDLFFEELAPLGWVKGKTVIYDVREAPVEQFPALAAELPNRPVTLIVAGSPPAVAAAQRVTRTIPIIALADDMKASGFASSIARPGGNTTGVSIFASELDVKRLALLAELVPTARRIAVLAESKAGPSMVRLDAAARELGIELVVVEARNGGEIGPALDSIVASRVEAVNVLASVVFCWEKGDYRPNGGGAPASHLSVARVSPRGGSTDRLRPAPGADRAADGWANRSRAARRPAQRPADRAADQIRTGDQSQTAKALGLDPPFTLLSRADEVIE